MVRQFGWICLALGLFIMSANTSQAQLRIGHQIPQRALRALGHGNGPGHHHCNPGPDVSYYNAWSHKNSFLISQSPEYLSRFGHETGRSPMQLLYTGQSPYAQHAPAGAFYGNAVPVNPVPMNADFVPSKPTTVDSDSNSEKNEWKADEAKADSDESELDADDDSDTEDQFETEAEKMDENSDDDFGSLDSFQDQENGTLERRSDQADDKGTASITPPSIFLPASNPVYGSGR